MSSKLIVAFVLALVLFSILDGIASGSGNMAVTRLTEDTTAVATTINVETTNGFLKSDYAVVGGESFQYTGTTDTSFTGVSRAYDGTTAAAHSEQTRVYSSQSDPLNAILGFNIASTGTTAGLIDIPILIGRFFTKTVPKLVTWNFGILTDTTVGQYIRIFLMAISAGFVIYLVIIIAQALGGILQGIFRVG